MEGEARKHTVPCREIEERRDQKLVKMDLLQPTDLSPKEFAPLKYFEAYLPESAWNVRL